MDSIWITRGSVDEHRGCRGQAGPVVTRVAINIKTGPILDSPWYGGIVGRVPLGLKGILQDQPRRSAGSTMKRRILQLRSLCQWRANPTTSRGIRKRRRTERVHRKFRNNP